MSAGSTLSVAVCQLTSTDDVSANVDQILRLLDSMLKIDSTVPDLICLPENCIYFRIRDDEAVPALELGAPDLQPLVDWSKRHGAALHLGSVPLAEGGRVFNTSLLLTPDGAREALYHKTHLFDVDVEGQKPVRESDAFAHGDGPRVFEYKGWRFGSSICYDVRFAELYLAYARLQVDAILIPAAFLVKTGQAHWEILLRARAIESQCYVLAAAQGGDHLSLREGRRSTYGHSMVVDPWGTVLGQAAEGPPSVVRTELQRKALESVRSQIPMSRHRRVK